MTSMTSKGKHFRLGNKDIVLHFMAEYAIRDQEALIDALSHNGYCVEDAETIESNKDAITHAKSAIRDFRRFLIP